ncbi:MAG: hypothetical protein ABJA94_05610 [Rhodoglobus sp.]
MHDSRSRVPEVTVAFWVLKLLTTGIGETTSDFFVKTFDPVPVVLLAAVVFIGCFVVQFTARRYVPWRYWLFVLMVAIFGTMVADVAHIVFDVPYALSSTVFAIVLVGLLVVWRLVEKTVSVHSIVTARRELFYWAVVLATFALGTAVGDLTAVTFGLGYFGSAVMFAVVFGVLLLVLRLGVVPVASFWAAYVFTRPFGASVADWLGVDSGRGGLALGTGPVSLVGLALIVAGVAIVQARSRARSLIVR